MVKSINSGIRSWPLSRGGVDANPGQENILETQGMVMRAFPDCSDQARCNDQSILLGHEHAARVDGNIACMDNVDSSVYVCYCISACWLYVV